MPAGRPRKYSKNHVQELCEKLEQYIAETRIPILAEFAYKNNVEREVFYKYDEFSTLIKKLISKKEAQLERLSLERKINHSMAIFSLKQLGWRDQPKEEDESKQILEDLVGAMRENAKAVLQSEAGESSS